MKNYFTNMMVQVRFQKINLCDDKIIVDTFESDIKCW